MAAVSLLSDGIMLSWGVISLGMGTYSPCGGRGEEGTLLVVIICGGNGAVNGCKVDWLRSLLVG